MTAEELRLLCPLCLREMALVEHGRGFRRYVCGVCGVRCDVSGDFSQPLGLIRIRVGEITVTLFGGE